MKLKQLHTTLLLTLCAALAACSEQEVVVDDPSTGSGTDNGKTPIELTVGGVDVPAAATRAVITDEKDGMIPFSENTSLYMLLQSDYVGAAPAKATQVTRTCMFAIPQSDGSLNYSDVNYSASNEYDKFVRYWDDTHARDAAISIVAVCTPGMGPGSSNTKSWNIGGSAAFANQAWTAKTGGASYPSVSWPIGNDNQINGGQFLTDQSRPFDNVSYIKNQDLCFSNNLNDYTSQSKGDRRLKFNWTTRKFEPGKLVFYHALSKLTFRIIKGEGFTDDEFKFNTDTNIKLTNFYSQGTLNLEAGEFVGTSLKKANGETGQNQPIDKIYQHPSLTTEETTAGYKYILDALVIPGTDMSANDDAVTFYINNNEYKLTMAQLYAAFTDAQKTSYFDSNKLKAGVHYVYTFTVGKTRVENLTATIVDWEQVEADNINPSNARITLNLEERNNNDKSNVLGSSDRFSIYRAADDKTTDGIDDSYAAYNWAKTYSNTGASLAWDSEHSHWKTDWYWDSNKNFYHFRALCEDNGTNKVAAPAITNDNGGDYLTLNHCEKTSSASYKDILWGAPMLDYSQNETNDAATLKWNYGPTTNGFDGLDTKATDAHQIYKAIGPTENQIKLTLFHMMSDVTFKVKTKANDQPDKVDLGNGTSGNQTTIELQKIHTTGKLFLGNGLVQGSTADVANSNYQFAASSSAPDANGFLTWANYGAIPQSLENVVLVITTPDHNQYKVAMKDVLAAASNAVSSNNIANPYSTVQSGANAGKYIINRWYPGFKYTYTFTLAKTGITNIQATIVDWETVTAEDETVQIQ